MATRARGWDCVLATVAAVILTVGSVARGQEGVAKASPDDHEELVERWGREVAAYSIVAHSEPEVALTLKSEPALRWTNPGAGPPSVWCFSGSTGAVPRRSHPSIGSVSRTGSWRRTSSCRSLLSA